MIFESKVFGSSNMKMENTLKNPNQYKEAIIFESLNNLSAEKRREFINSAEAKAMIESGVISQDTVDRLQECDTDCITLKTTVCHMAKEESDPLWDELVECRIKERRLINELIEKYGEKAKTVSDKVEKEIVEASIPEYFRK